jgi:hypothetical protein
MLLSQLDADDIFSLTLWRSETGYCVGVQKHAGDIVKYETRKTASAAIEAALGLVRIAPPPY